MENLAGDKNYIKMTVQGEEKITEKTEITGARVELKNEDMESTTHEGT